jgi:hypothetical protein
VVRNPLDRKDDGTQALVLHRAKDYFLNESFTTTMDNGNLRDTATNTKLAQRLKVDISAAVDFVDILYAGRWLASGLRVALTADRCRRIAERYRTRNK